MNGRARKMKHEDMKHAKRRFFLMFHVFMFHV
jgi:hypothetical protein